MVGQFGIRETKRANIKQKGKVGVERLDDVQGGSTIPNNFPKKRLNFRRNIRSPNGLMGERGGRRGSRKDREKRGNGEKARGRGSPKTRI